MSLPATPAAEATPQIVESAELGHMKNDEAGRDDVIPLMSGNPRASNPGAGLEALRLECRRASRSIVSPLASAATLRPTMALATD